MGLLGLSDSATNYGASCKTSANRCGIGTVVTPVMLPRAMIAWALMPIMAIPIVSVGPPPSVAIPLNVLDGVASVRVRGDKNRGRLTGDCSGESSYHCDQKCRYLLHLLIL